MSKKLGTRAETIEEFFNEWYFLDIEISKKGMGAFIRHNGLEKLLNKKKLVDLLKGNAIVSNNAAHVLAEFSPFDVSKEDIAEMNRTSWIRNRRKAYKIALEEDEIVHLYEDCQLAREIRDERNKRIEIVEKRRITRKEKERLKSLELAQKRRLRVRKLVSEKEELLLKSENLDECAEKKKIDKKIAQILAKIEKENKDRLEEKQKRKNKERNLIAEENVFIEGRVLRRFSWHKTAESKRVAREKALEKYNANNKEKIAESKAKWRERNLLRAKLSEKRYQEHNREKINKRSNERYKKKKLQEKGVVLLSFLRGIADYKEKYGEKIEARKDLSPEYIKKQKISEQKRRYCQSRKAKVQKNDNSR